MTEHTRGPWRIGNARHMVFGPKREDGGLAVTIATVGRAEGAARANARLIAAAPELLEALEACDDLFTRYLMIGKGQPEANKVTELVREAIAKAKGGRG